MQRFAVCPELLAASLLAQQPVPEVESADSAHDNVAVGLGIQVLSKLLSGERINRKTDVRSRLEVRTAVADEQTPDGHLDGLARLTRVEVLVCADLLAGVEKRNLRAEASVATACQFDLCLVRAVGLRHSNILLV